MKLKRQLGVLAKAETRARGPQPIVDCIRENLRVRTEVELALGRDRSANG